MRGSLEPLTYHCITRSMVFLMTGGLGRAMSLVPGKRMGYLYEVVKSLDPSEH